MSDLNDQSEVCFDHQSPSLLVSLFNTRRQLNLLFRSEQRGPPDLAKANFDDRIRILTSHISERKLNMHGRNPQKSHFREKASSRHNRYMWRAFAKCYRVV